MSFKFPKVDIEDCASGTWVRLVDEIVQVNHAYFEQDRKDIFYIVHKTSFDGPEIITTNSQNIEEVLTHQEYPEMYL